MSIEAEEKLQRQIESCIREHSCEGISRIELDRGSDVTDLTRCADIRVYYDTDINWRLFSVCSVKFINDVLLEQETTDIYTRGGPFIVVREISGDVIVRSVVKYLELEEGRKDRWIPRNFRRQQGNLS
ncbi:MAG: hypothetical protein HJJLKODD_00971 [Phycisphaerae bacterium]|nr:hypothetical protein [Phycisphaerae bacterium]